MLKKTLMLSSLVVLPLLMACPDPPPQVAGSGAARGDDQGNSPNRGGSEGDPDSMDLSPGGTVLLDISKVVPQSTQEEIAASGEPIVTLSGTIAGLCDGGSLRIDVIEVGIEHTDQGPMVGPVASLSPSGPGPYSMVVPKGKNIQVAALCDIDNDGKIVQDTDKLAPGVALGVVEEDTEGVDLVFPGEGDTPVQIGVPNGDVRPPGDTTASMPSAAAGERDRGEDQPAGEGAPPAPGPDAPDGAPPAAD